MNERETFFYENGGWSFDPARETSDDGRKRCARESAESEVWSELTGIVFEWSEDWSIGNHREFYGSDSAYADREPDTCEVVCAFDASGRFLASLGCVDDANDAYRRVVQAELASEAYANQSVPSA